MRNMAIIAGVGATALLAGGTALWLTEGLAVSPTLNGVRIGGAW